MNVIKFKTGYYLLKYGEEEKMPEPVILNKQMIEKLFDGAAISYDKVGPGIFTKYGLKLIEGLPIKPGMCILDIATGTGAVLFPAAHHVGQDGRIIGIDLSESILREAENIVNVKNLANIELRKMDAEHLEFPDKSFDLVTCAFAIFLFPDVEAALSEMYRVCKPGGYIAMTNFNKLPVPFGPALPVFIQQCMMYGVGVQPPQPLAYSPEDITTLLNKFGFTSVETWSETNDIVYTNNEDWWGFMMTLAPRTTILGMDEETRERFREEYFAKLNPMFQKDGLHVSLSVVYASARRE
jgi:ubiquinone/menaquinone biosynthesis C-methylase UbiE